ncbi:MAG: mechanosensitive ion channel family protein [Planctomycetes bacterium]|nr:mechanosensitive ion channel family protein [Planctomycetota bacterium]
MSRPTTRSRWVARARLLTVLAASVLALACAQESSQRARTPLSEGAVVSTETKVSVAPDGQVSVHLQGATLREGLERVATRTGLAIKIEADLPEVRLYVSFEAADAPSALRALATIGGVTYEQYSQAGLTLHRVGTSPRDLFEHGPYHFLLGALILFSAYVLLRGFSAFVGRLESVSRERGKKLRQLGPLVRVVVWVIAIVSAIMVMLRVSPTAAFAFTGGGLLLLGIAARELTANLLAGFTIAIDRPLYVGDFVEVAGQRGEVKGIGLRSTQLVTPDDTMITIPNKVISEGVVASANYGEVDALVEITFYVAHEADVSVVRNLVWEGLVTSAYCAWRKPARVFVSEEPRATKVVAAAYVYDVRHQRRYVTDVTHRVKAAFAEAGVPYPKIDG